MKQQNENVQQPQKPNYNYDSLQPGTRLCGKFIVEQVIGKGSFGTIYQAQNKETQEKVAIKMESNQNREHKNIYLLKEAKILYDLNEQKGCIFNDLHHIFIGFPKMLFFAKDDETSTSLVVMTLFGKNLEYLLKKNGNRFSLPTVLLFAEQAITRLEFLHSKHYIHRDLKPENFVIGNTEETFDVINLIDFGLSKKFIENNCHIKQNNNAGFVGTSRYASLNAQLAGEQSRRDDLESLGYILIYFIKGYQFRLFNIARVITMNEYYWCNKRCKKQRNRLKENGYKF